MLGSNKKDKTILMKYKMHAKEWKYNIPKIVEAVVLLDLINTTSKKLYHVENVSIGIAIDNKKI